MGDLTDDQSGNVGLVGQSGLQADVINDGGIHRVATSTTITSVNVPLGKDPIPDMYVTILTAPSAIGDTLQIQIAGTTKDSTTPDRDLPALDETYVAVAADIGDELAFANNFADWLNAQPSIANAFLAVEAVDDNRAVIHITSTIFSLNGEFAERPNAADVSFTATGGITLLQDGTNDRLLSRAKEVSLARDPNNPHRLGVQNVSGTVRLRAQEVEQILKEYLTDVLTGLSDQLAVDGSITPVYFRISANPVGGLDKVVEILKFIISDTNIKVSGGKFLGENSPLANGIEVKFYKDGVLRYTEPLIRETREMLGQWTVPAGTSDIISQSGGDYLESSFSLVGANLQFPLRAGKNDYIEVKIQDKIDTVDSMKLLAGGFLE